MVAAAALALGCGGTEIDAAKTEDTIKAELERSAGLKISEVDCPTGIEVEVDSTFECTLTADGEEKSARLRILSDDADLELVNQRAFE